MKRSFGIKLIAVLAAMLLLISSCADPWLGEDTTMIVESIKAHSSGKCEYRIEVYAKNAYDVQTFQGHTKMIMPVGWFNVKDTVNLRK